MTGPKIGTLDIETAPIVAYVWGLWKQNIGLNQIIRDWSILSFTYKWLHQKRCVYMDVSSKEDLSDDGDLLQALWDFLDEADIVVAQNGISFDIKKIMARFIEAGLPPPSPFRVVDTMLEARKVARFTSNKLAWLSEKLTDTPKLSHSEFPGFLLWVECLKHNPKAWRVMKKYNPVDVIGTEKLYLRLRPYIVGHPNVAAYYEDNEVRCPKCGSAALEKRGFAYTQTGQYQRYRCECGGWARGRYTLNTTEKRQALLSN